MKYLVCPDSFKGSMTALDAAAAIASALRDVDHAAEITLLPLADGGEGTAEIVGAAFHGRRIQVDTVDALMRPIVGSYYLAEMNGKPVAVVDVATAIGLTLIDSEERDIIRATSFGAGILMNDALKRGIRNFIVGLGGTATCDAGKGMREAMTGDGLDYSSCGITVLCDVDNPLCGPQGAARVFAPQKGADPGQVEVLEKRLIAAAAKMKSYSGIEAADLQGGGAAGGIGAMLATCFGAELASGIDYILDVLDFNALQESADVIITGEGKIDRQTMHGKTIAGILRRTSKPVVAFAGKIESTPGLNSRSRKIVQITSPDMPLAEAMDPETAKRNLSAAVKTAFTHAGMRKI